MLFFRGVRSFYSEMFRQMTVPVCARRLLFAGTFRRSGLISFIVSDYARPVSGSRSAHGVRCVLLLFAEEVYRQGAEHRCVVRNDDFVCGSQRYVLKFRGCLRVMAAVRSLPVRRSGGTIVSVIKDGVRAVSGSRSVPGPRRPVSPCRKSTSAGRRRLSRWP